MTDIALPTSTPASLRTMAGIEARRLARHPAFIVGVVLAFGVLVLLFVIDDDPHLGDLLSMPVIPAFFIGLPSLVATARLTRSTEATAEAIGTAPGSEGRRTAALALACLVPFAAGAVWIAVELALVVRRTGRTPTSGGSAPCPTGRCGPSCSHSVPVACLGGGTARRAHRTLAALPRRRRGDGGRRRCRSTWSARCRSPTTAASELRLWVPWAMFHSGARDRRHRDPVRRQRRLLPGLPALPLRRRRALRHLARPHRPHRPAPRRDRRRRHRRARRARAGDDHRQRRQPAPRSRSPTRSASDARRLVPAPRHPLDGAARVLCRRRCCWPSRWTGGRRRALVLLPGLVASCAAAAAFCFDEVSLPVVEVTPRGATWRRTARLAAAARAPRRLDRRRRSCAPGDLPLDAAARGCWSGSPPSRLTVGLAAPGLAPRGRHARAGRWPPRWCWS